MAGLTYDDIVAIHRTRPLTREELEDIFPPPREDVGGGSSTEEEDEVGFLRNYNPNIPVWTGARRVDRYIYLTPSPAEGGSQDFYSWRKSARVPLREYREHIHLPLAYELNYPKQGPVRTITGPPRRATSKRAASAGAPRRPAPAKGEGKGDPTGSWVRTETWAWVEPAWSAADWQEWNSWSGWDSRPKTRPPPREDTEEDEEFRRHLDHIGWGAPTAPDTPPVPTFVRSKPREPSHSPPPHLRRGESARGSNDPPPVHSSWDSRDIRDPSTFGEYVPRAFEIARNSPPVLQPAAKTTRHPVAKSSALLRARQVEAAAEAIAEEFHSPTEVVSESEEEVITTPVTPVPTAAARPPLKVALDFHNVIQLTRWSRNSRGESFEECYIPQAHVEAIRRLSVTHDVWIFSFAGRARALELRQLLWRAGITEIIGGAHKIVSHPEIEARVSGPDKWTGQYKTGKSEVCARHNVDVLVDDGIDIIREAKAYGVIGLGIDSPGSIARGKYHFGGFPDLVAAIDHLQTTEYFTA